MEGYHPVPGNSMGDDDDEDDDRTIEDRNKNVDTTPATGSGDKVEEEEYDEENEFGESPQYEICDATDIQIDRIPLLHIPSVPGVERINVAQEPLFPDTSSGNNTEQLDDAETDDTPSTRGPAKRMLQRRPVYSPRRTSGRGRAQGCRGDPPQCPQVPLNGA